VSYSAYSGSPYSDDWSYGLAGAFANLSNTLLGATVEVYTDLQRPVDEVQADLAAQGWSVPLDVLAPYTLPAAGPPMAALAPEATVSTPSPAAEYPAQYEAATDFGRAVFDSATSGPVYDDEWVLAQVAALDGVTIEEEEQIIRDLQGRGDPDTFSGNLPPDILGDILGETQPTVFTGGGSGASPSTAVGPDASLPPFSQEGSVSIFSEIAGGLLSSLPDVLGDVFGTATPGSGYTVGGGFGGSYGLPLTSSGGSPSGMPTAGSAPRGYRWNAARGRWVKRRRMNPCNVHALRRALRRTEGFIRIEKRVDKIVNRAARAAGGARRHGFVRGKRK